MSNDNNKTDIEQAVEEVNPSEVSENLDPNNAENDESNSANLSEQQETPFIDDELRTDK